MNGVLAGTFAPTGCRSSWCGRSPLTGIWNEANLAHYWGAELRLAGYDGLIITGRAESPTYLWINGVTGAIEFRDAGHLWGRDWFEAGDALLAETDPKGQVAGIGTAGERLIKIAGIMCGPSNYVRAAAGGMGALLGSKNLKAIAVRGKARPEYPDPKRFRDEVKAQNEFIKEHSQPMSNLGTAGGVLGTEKFGDLPIRNWSLGNWSEAVNLAGQTFYPKYLVKHTHCYACPIGCGKEIEVKDEPYASPRGEGVEYETLAGFGGACGVSSFEAVALANSLCNRYGLDTISTAGVIAFAMEAFERGLIGLADTGGIELRFGNADAMLALIGKIARQEDIGAMLAEGVRDAARRIGQGSEAFAIHVKGLEVAYHDPRAFVSMAVNYATAARGGCHLEAASFWNGYGIPHPDLGYPKPLPLHDVGRGHGQALLRLPELRRGLQPAGAVQVPDQGAGGAGAAVRHRQQRAGLGMDDAGCARHRRPDLPAQAADQPAAGHHRGRRPAAAPLRDRAPAHRRRGRRPARHGGDAAAVLRAARLGTGRRTVAGAFGETGRHLSREISRKATKSQKVFLASLRLCVSY